jgi:hypothetical protein
MDKEAVLLEYLQRIYELAKDDNGGRLGLRMMRHAISSLLR